MYLEQANRRGSQLCCCLPKPLSNPSAKLSPEGRHLVNDLKDVIEQAKVLLLTKNQGNLLQDFIYQTGQMSGGNAKRPGAPIDKGTAQQHGNQAMEGLRTLGTLMISNGQFRKLCTFPASPISSSPPANISQ